MAELQHTLALIQTEYAEMPGLKLTVRQAARLWVLAADQCHIALETLTAGGFLIRTRDGAYVRSH
jgi:hypothetical protein